MRPVIALAALVVFLALCTTVVKNEPAAAQAGDGGITVFFSADKFDAEGYVDSIWADRILPYMNEKAVDFAELSAALKADAEAAGAKYGYRAVAEGNPYSFSIKGRVKILSANVKSKNGRLEADFAPYDGTADAVMQVGPIYRGTSIRDFLDFVTFDQFKNQVEFAKLASQLNLTANASAVVPAGLPGDGAVGKEFDIVCATTFEKPGVPLSIVPVVLKPVGE